MCPSFRPFQPVKVAVCYGDSEILALNPALGGQIAEARALLLSSGPLPLRVPFVIFVVVLSLGNDDPEKFQ